MNWEHSRVNYEYKRQNIRHDTANCAGFTINYTHETGNNGPLRLNYAHIRENYANARCTSTWIITIFYPLGTPYFKVHSPASQTCFIWLMWFTVIIINLFLVYWLARKEQFISYRAENCKRRLMDKSGKNVQSKGMFKSKTNNCPWFKAYPI